ncbi:MAG: type II toxin-antitoxin system RelE/ParE family toxin [Methylobacterium sp.]|nr:type II toxin-antitoxin system RelE/ParE family toxin [Methylobacterium sp.]
MIQSFKDARSRHLFETRECPSQWSSIMAVILRKLDMLDAASVITDLRSPPGNRLEKLVGDRKGQWSIRINDQWRICFRWNDAGPYDVEVVDYH